MIHKRRNGAQPAPEWCCSKGFGGIATNKQWAVFTGVKIARIEAVGPSMPCLLQ